MLRACGMAKKEQNGCDQQIEDAMALFRKIRDTVSTVPQAQPMSLPNAPHKTVVFYHHACLGHAVPHWHPECPRRLEVSMVALERLMQESQQKAKETSSKAAVVLQSNPSPVQMDILALVHTPQYLRSLESSPWLPSDEPMALHLPNGEPNPTTEDTFISRNGLQAAYLAAGAVCEAVDYVMQGRSCNAFCCVRPPGHHAGRRGLALGAESNGFCILNNVATGCAYARVMYPSVKRVVVLDFDVHHGNGTEEILQGDHETLFLSVQRHGGNFFPCLSGATCSEGNVCNVGLPEGYSSEAFRHALKRTILPKLHGFRPDLILVSAGFDGHSSDPIGGAKLEEDDFAWATARILQVAEVHCKGRVVSVLEGGYNARAPEGGLASCVSAHVKILCGLEKLVVETEPEPEDNNSAFADFMSMAEQQAQPEAMEQDEDKDEDEDVGKETGGKQQKEKKGDDEQQEKLEEQPSHQEPASPSKPALQLAPTGSPSLTARVGPATPQPGILSPLASRSKAQMEKVTSVDESVLENSNEEPEEPKMSEGEDDDQHALEAKNELIDESDVKGQNQNDDDGLVINDD